MPKPLHQLRVERDLLYRELHARATSKLANLFQAAAARPGPYAELAEFLGDDRAEALAHWQTLELQVAAAEAAELRSRRAERLDHPEPLLIHQP